MKVLEIQVKSQNKLVAVNPHTGKVAATADRKNPGCIWFVKLWSHSAKGPHHVRISGKLPERVQFALVKATPQAAGQ